jgi:protein-arginine kinase activator protein McsA
MQTQLNRLQDLNITFEKVPNTRKELEQRWEEAFTQKISKAQKRKITFRQCMWNVFSWEKIRCLKEQRAIEAFNEEKKAGCFLIYTSEEEALYLPKASRLKAKDVIHFGSPGDEHAKPANNLDSDNLDAAYSLDLYVVDEHFAWTYVLTHEANCGPYFYKPENFAL